MKLHDKLIRDKIPQIIEGLGKTAKIEIILGKQKEEYLEKKLGEEVNEYLEDKNLEELADHLGYTEEDLLNKCRKKYNNMFILNK